MDEYPFTEHVQAISPLDGNAIDGSRRPKPRQVRRQETQEFPVTVTRIHPSVKRLTPRQEERGAEMFGKGWSERQVAKALDISPSSAHRLRLRLAGTPPKKEGLAARALKEGKGWSVQPVVVAGTPVGEIVDLESRRAQLARELEELDVLLADVRRKELREAMEAVGLLSPRWEPLAEVWGRLQGELEQLQQSL